ncbi:MAG: tetratricopeptide repeat protein [Candidatus Omnitrophica bacterium]|nr:tetratricopeptide repeat protein [Candidatus Omnitrophota bacterium]
MPFQKFLKRYLPFFIPLLVFIVYLPCLRAGFVNWDDNIHVLNNFCFKSPHGLNLPEIWTSTINNTYIPLTATTWAIEHCFFGFNPFVFHLDNILLHLVTVVLVIIFSRRMGLSAYAAALAGLLFGIHPMHVESVAWVTERKDVLYGVLYMSALLAYLHYLDTGRKEYFWLTLFLGELSICAKPMAVSLPFVLLVLDWFRGRRWTFQTLVEKVFCAAVLVPIAFITYIANSVLVHPALGQGLFIWAWCFMFYLYKFLFPFPLLLFYGFPQSAAVFYLNVPVFLGFVMALWFYRRNRWFVFAVSFYFANIFFLLRFSPFLLYVADRFMYLPSVGLCMFFAVSVEKLFFWVKGRRSNRYSFYMALCVLLAVMTALTWRQCEVWQSSVTLWRHQLKYDSKTAAWLAYSKLADAYAAADKHLASDARQFNRVQALYLKAAELKPDSLYPYLGLGKLFESAGDFGRAQKYYEQAVLIDHNNFDALFSLGRVFQKRKMPQQAIGFYRKAMAADPFLCSYVLKPAFLGGLLQEEGVGSRR